MDYFYDGQLRKYLTQFIRALSGFSYKDGQGNLKEVPVRFGTANKQAANVLRQNSENFVMQAPFISVYINNLELSRNRMQDPTFVSKVQVREREYDTVSGEYVNTKGSDVTVERIMPNPFQLSMIADIWTSNIDQKLQILEQLVVLFNPALEIQTSSSYLDWTSLTTLELMDISYTNQTVPTGDQDLEIASLTFMAPIWLSPPAKVKRMGVITSIIARIFDEEGNLSDDILNGTLISQQVVTLDGYAILVTNNATGGTPQYVAKLLTNTYSVQNNFDSKATKISNDVSWRDVLDRYPGRFTPNLSKLQIIKADNRTAIATLSLNSNDETLLNLTFDAQSLPTNTLINSTVNGIASRGTIDAIIDPSKPYTMNRIVDLRFLILSDITTENRNYGPSNASLEGVEQWGDLQANANDIIMWDGTEWKVIFNSQAIDSLTYITNAYTGVQYKWDGTSWTKSMEGTFVPGKWQLIL